jgi:hypothetical protein
MSFKSLLPGQQSLSPQVQWARRPFRAAFCCSDLRPTKPSFPSSSTMTARSKPFLLVAFAFMIALVEGQSPGASSASTTASTAFTGSPPGSAGGSDALANTRITPQPTFRLVTSESASPADVPVVPAEPVATTSSASAVSTPQPTLRLVTGGGTTWTADSPSPSSPTPPVAVTSVVETPAPTFHAVTTSAPVVSTATDSTAAPTTGSTATDSTTTSPASTVALSPSLDGSYDLSAHANGSASSWSPGHTFQDVVRNQTSQPSGSRDSRQDAAGSLNTTTDTIDSSSSEVGSVTFESASGEEDDQVGSSGESLSSGADRRLLVAGFQMAALTILSAFVVA